MVNQVILQAASLRRFHPDAQVRAFVGHAFPSAPRHHGWVENLFRANNISFEWVTGRSFEQWANTRAPHLETINRRWSDLVEADHIIIADADVMFVSALDDILSRDAVQGVQAHVPPLSCDDFAYLFAICGAPLPGPLIPFTGAGFMAPANAKGVFYPNSGMVVLPRAHFDAMVQHYHFAISRIRSVMSDIYWADQLALSIAAARAGVPVHSLPVRYNFPNQREFEERYPDDLRDVRVLHYLREDRISRTKDFESLASLRRLVDRSDLTGSHEVLRQTIAANLWALEPAPLGSVGTEPPWA